MHACISILVIGYGYSDDVAGITLHVRMCTNSLCRHGWLEAFDELLWASTLLKKALHCHIKTALSATRTVQSIYAKYCETLISCGHT